MQNKYIYEALPENFKLENLVPKIRSEIESMGYSVTLQKKEDGETVFYIEKNIAPMEIFLGRWQKLRATLAEKGSVLTLKFDKKDKIDKIVCFTTGTLFFFIPYIFCFLAIGNRNDIQWVFEKTVDDFIIKRKSEISSE